MDAENNVNIKPFIYGSHHSEGTSMTHKRFSEHSHEERDSWIDAPPAIIWLMELSGELAQDSTHHMEGRRHACLLSANLISQTPYTCHQGHFPMNTCKDEMESGKYILYSGGIFNFIWYFLDNTTFSRNTLM